MVPDDQFRTDFEDLMRILRCQTAPPANLNEQEIGNCREKAKVVDKLVKPDNHEEVVVVALGVELGTYPACDKVGDEVESTVKDDPANELVEPTVRNITRHDYKRTGHPRHQQRISHDVES